MSNYINRNDLIELIKQMPSECKPEWADYERVIRCKDCKWYNGHERYCSNDVYARENGYCYCAERKDKFVPLRHEDIHFNSEEDEKAFYEALAERKEE